jgi:acetoacetyl-CoA synthetase
MNSIYNVIDSLPESSGVEDSICVGQKVGQDERVVLFIKMREGYRFTPQLRADIVNAIQTKLSRRHIPAVIMEAPEIVRAGLFFFVPPHKSANMCL